MKQEFFWRKWNMQTLINAKFVAKRLPVLRLMEEDAVFVAGNSSGDLLYKWAGIVAANFINSLKKILEENSTNTKWYTDR